MQSQMNNGLNLYQIRKVLDVIFDGTPQTFFYIKQIQAFYVKKKSNHREHQIYLWCIRNKVTGQKFVDFFDHQGFLNGLNYIVNKLNGNKNHLKNINLEEAL